MLIIVLLLKHSFTFAIYPIPFMYDLFTYMLSILMVDVAKYTIHGCYGYVSYHACMLPSSKECCDSFRQSRLGR